MTIYASAFSETLKVLDFLRPKALERARVLLDLLARDGAMIMI
jgi:hypothetical protein